jgi:hypothetical protein
LLDGNDRQVVRQSMGRAAGAIDERARCQAPAEEFVAFARGLMAPRAQRRLQDLAATPVADLFARRLVKEALSGAPHALTCLQLVGQLGQEPSWAVRLQQGDAAGQPPALASVPLKELEPAGRGLLVISRQQALPWLAEACLKATGKAASQIETLLLAAAPTTRALVEALDVALGTLRSADTAITSSVAGRAIGAMEKHAARLAACDQGAQDSPLLQLAQSAKGKQAARLLSSLALALLADEPVEAGGVTAEPPVAPSTDKERSKAASEATRSGAGVPLPTRGVAEAAWSDADEALGRALQEMDFLVRSFERLESAAQGEAADRVRRARNASKLVLQWVEQAAHYRRVAVLNKPGDRVPFDPAFHDLYGRAAMGELVRIVKPAVVRGSEPEQVVLLRAEAELD